MEKLLFLFTKQGFRVDEATVLSAKDTAQWAARFTQDPYKALYCLAFQEKPACFDAAGGFLCQLAERFAEDLAAAPGLELTRQSTEITPADSSLEQLLNCVPFVLGAEFVTKN